MKLLILQRGDLRALAVTLLSRSAIVPDLPTLNETVRPDFDMESWTGILAPAGTPQPVAERLNGEMNEIISAPNTQQRLAELGAEAQPTSPVEFGRFIQVEVAKWGKLVNDAGIQPA